MAEDTRDEAYFWISRRRESKMESQLRTLKGVAGEVTAELGGQNQGHLDEYSGKGSSTDGSDDGGVATEASDEGDANAGDDGASAGAANAGTTNTKAESAADLPASTQATNGETTANTKHEASDVQSGLATFGRRDDGDDDSDDLGGSSGDSGVDEEGTIATASCEGETVETVEIVADQRELDATIARDLSTRDGVEVRLETLAVGDYVLSDRAVVERKSTTDFVDSLLGEGDRSIFEQVGDAARHYARPVVIVEGEGLYEQRNVHPNAIRGALASLAIDFRASVLRTRDEGDTADLLEVIARREQETDDREVSVHGEKGAKTLSEQQEYVVAAIAEIGPVTARSLLTHFGSVEAVMTADEDDLTAVEGIGGVTAERITEVTHSTYDPD